MARLIPCFTCTAALFLLAPHSPDAATSGGPVSTKSQETGAVALSHEIHHQLLLLPFYSVFDWIQFTLQGHNVILTGHVVRPSLKENAEATVRAIEGVGVVVNQIEVLPASASDDDLRRAVYRALYEDSTLARYAVQTIPPIHIIVENGAVSLEGAVDSPPDKTLAATRAAHVPKVTGVKNNLVVHPRGSASE